MTASHNLSVVTVDINGCQVRGNSDLQSLTLFTERSEYTGEHGENAKRKKKNPHILSVVSVYIRPFSARAQTLINSRNLRTIKALQQSSLRHVRTGDSK